MRCCALDEAALPDQLGLELLEEQAVSATKLFNERKYTEAEALALKLLDLAPNLRHALRVLYEIRKAQKRVKAAEALGRRLSALPGTAEMRAAANLSFAQYILGQGRFAEAREAAERALIAAPRDASAHQVMGMVLTETGQVQPGEYHYRQALALLGRDEGVLLSNLAWNLKLQGRQDEAAELYEKALTLRPDNKRGVGGYAQAEMARGNQAHAARLLGDALTKWPDDRALRLLYARLELTRGNAAAVLARLNDAPENLLPLELSTRGQALALQGELTQAVACYATAKKILREREGWSYQAETFAAQAAAYKAYFTADRILPLPRAAEPPTRQPVFLLGFPGSGASLLEQLLAHLPGCAPGAEFATIADLAARVERLTGAGAYPQALDGALVGEGQDLPVQLRGYYQQARDRLGARARFMTDNTPSNLWHLGLIKLLFPEAPIIHILRHPCDVMLDVLSRAEKLEGNAGVSLASAARHYALSMEMVKHYRAQLTLRYLPVRYEDLVTAPRATLTRVVEFIGADAANLPSEETLRTNAIRPAGPVPSHFAARVPVHTRGVYQYRAYLAALPNLFIDTGATLAPWISALGYGDAP
ncbi:MAG TPA: sulfotransferase [Acidocella sp.]|nr:sulfotransferase [Acidocella sp.]